MIDSQLVKSKYKVDKLDFDKFILTQKRRYLSK
ncbi:hypothetical protein Dfer_1031 [Dyadobacter fermentans DSM 18053]|uniref:Uncharacterized protein n=1 Tax=Dyadobacter fermentans (strain ATCC 700827 / DSM 18053 / CIP 107007 / KCTC 52180 / NS114) TaxID=471854 RepID=C6W443_DYAFD|nr:hypothetical protein Dfer_1031 [Dyadobacter fermentans DSM 18053]